MDQATTRDPVPLLRGADEDRANAHWSFCSRRPCSRPVSSGEPIDHVKQNATWHPPGPQRPQAEPPARLESGSNRRTITRTGLPRGNATPATGDPAPARSAALQKLPNSPKHIFCEPHQHSRAGLVQQTVQIVASHDLTLFVGRRPRSELARVSVCRHASRIGNGTLSSSPPR